ncbi:MAG TPA: ATPase [Rikenellaceae bacterium]|nr:ATPase [Rikenellaceae bacterium]
MKEAVIKQKMERDRLLAYDYQERIAQQTAILYRDSKMIKLITGPRRAGKSSLALQMLRGQNFAYLNFDDSALLDGFDESKVEDLLEEVYSGYKFLLLDEVQNLTGWSIWVEKLYRRGTNLVITGSNANMLSDDIAAILSGRYLEIRLYPFSAEEYKSYRQKSEQNAVPENVLYDNFLKYGGYPEIALTPQVCEGYISSLYDSTIVKDIVKRYKVRKVDELYNVADWLLSNFTNTFSITSLADDLNMGSVTTVQKYCRYLQNTYLFQYLPRFNNKMKLMNKADRKCYVVDNGYILARAFELSSNLGRLLENMVFLELLKKGYNLKMHELFYYRSRNDKEVDFVCRKGVTIQQLIQVCYDMSPQKTRKREVDSLIECAGELKVSKLLIITWGQDEIFEKDGYTIEVISVRNWTAIRYNI